jgi:xyloglucan-specific endo-beta-1,4-glucanase
MRRLGRFGNVYPIGTSQGTVNVGGRSWELWYGLNGAMKVYTFTPPSPINNYNGNMKDFFTYLTNNKGYPASTQYLISKFYIRRDVRHAAIQVLMNLVAYQFGTEAFTGGPAAFTVSKWSAEAN